MKMKQSQKNNSIITELAIHGISITDDGQCMSNMQGENKTIKMPIKSKIKEIDYEIDEFIEGLKGFWHKACLLLSKDTGINYRVSSVTQKLFIDSVKHLYKLSSKHEYLKQTDYLFKQVLNSDSVLFSEMTMSKFIDYRICIDYLNHLIEDSYFCKHLLELVNPQDKLAQMQMSPYGIQSLPMSERVHEIDEIDEAEEDKENKDKRNQLRYTMGLNKEWLSRGFTWEEPRNHPFAWGDPDSDPYPHYYNFKTKKHRSLDR